MIRCKDLVDFLMAYLDGELPPNQRARFDEHLGDCPPCCAYLDTYRQTVALGREVCDSDHDDIPEDVPEALVRAVLEARRAGGSGKS